MPKSTKTESVSETETPLVPVTPSRHRQLVLGVAAALLGVALVTWGVVQYRHNRALEAELAQVRSGESRQATDAEIQQLVDTVSKLLVLPTGEQPTVATVTDPAKLASQPFFANAQVGDKVLIYSTAKKAVLFRPSDNKIVEVGPVTVGDEADKAATPEAGLTKKAK